jgi:hypothetical protein
MALYSLGRQVGLASKLTLTLHFIQHRLQVGVIDLNSLAEFILVTRLDRRTDLALVQSLRPL